MTNYFSQNKPNKFKSFSQSSTKLKKKLCSTPNPAKIVDIYRQRMRKESLFSTLPTPNLFSAKKEKQFKHFTPVCEILNRKYHQSTKNSQHSQPFKKKQRKQSNRVKNFSSPKVNLIPKSSLFKNSKLIGKLSSKKKNRLFS